MSEENLLDRAKRVARNADSLLDTVGTKLSFADEIDRVSSRRAGLGKLSGELARARARGWAWGPDWEPRCKQLEVEGPRVGDEVQRAASAATARFRGTLDAVRRKLTGTFVNGAHVRQLEAIEREADDLKDAVAAEEQRLTALARPFQDPYDALQKEVGDAHKHLDRFDTAKFKLQPGESMYRTSECTWQDSPNGAVNGFLYLSDQRVRFEQKETVTTKKFLFFTASSEEKHECLLDEPVGNIARSDDSTSGMVFKDQLVTLTWQNARVKKTVFDINSGETAKDWDTWIEELRTGALSHRKIGGGGGAVAAAPPPTTGMPVDAPTKCKACDAALDAPVRGQTSLVCKYCGNRHDLKFA